MGIFGIDLPGAGVDKFAQSARFVADDAASCKGKFASGSIPDESGSNNGVVRVFTSCDDNGGLSVFYQIIPRPRGGLYLIGTIAAGDPTAAREDDTEIRSAVFKSLNN